MLILFILMVILLAGLVIFVKPIYDNESPEVEKFLNQLQLLTTSNLITWTKHDHSSYSHKIVYYKATTKIGVFVIKISRKHEDELKLPIFDQICISAIPFTQPFEIDISKSVIEYTNINLMEKFQHLRQLIEIQLKRTFNGETTHE